MPKLKSEKSSAMRDLKWAVTSTALIVFFLLLVFYGAFVSEGLHDFGPFRTDVLRIIFIFGQAPASLYLIFFVWNTFMSGGVKK